MSDVGRNELDRTERIIRGERKVLKNKFSCSFLQIVRSGTREPNIGAHCLEVVQSLEFIAFTWFVVSKFGFHKFQQGPMV